MLAENLWNLFRSQQNTTRKRLKTNTRREAERGKQTHTQTTVKAEVTFNTHFGFVIQTKMKGLVRQHTSWTFSFVFPREKVITMSIDGQPEIYRHESQILLLKNCQFYWHHTNITSSFSCYVSIFLLFFLKTE